MKSELKGVCLQNQLSLGQVGGWRHSLEAKAKSPNSFLDVTGTFITANGQLTVKKVMAPKAHFLILVHT